MTEVPNKKFKYKKDGQDWILIGIILFTIVCFAAIFYGIDYFNELGTNRSTDNSSQIENYEENKAALERQIQEYLVNPASSSDETSTSSGIEFEAVEVQTSASQ